MSEPISPEPPSETTSSDTPEPGERRGTEDDRRHGSIDPGRRRAAPSRRRELAHKVGFYTFAVVTLTCVILFAVSSVSPIFARKVSYTSRILAHADSAAKLGVPPTDTLVAGTGVLRFKNPKTEDERRRFAADLVATGRMKQERADSIAFFAVREALGRGIPPALMLGVMLTENAVFVSKARSNVGAVGLMQIYPKVWLKALRHRFGGDLEEDETNLRYGAFILAEYLKPKKGAEPTYSSVRRGLLKYNGCVRGTNTPRCHTYPDKIERYVRNDAKALCRGKGFEECIARPFIAGLTGDTTAMVSAAN